MKGLIQRVSHASVKINEDTVGRIGEGILVLLGVEREDSTEKADKLLRKILKYRIFPDAHNKMNRSVSDIKGGLLIISQFTLAADTRKGLRPGFSSAAAPLDGEALYSYFVQQAKKQHSLVETGSFGADMKVELLNDGPVTFMLES